MPQIATQDAFHKALDYLRTASLGQKNSSSLMNALLLQSLQAIDAASLANVRQKLTACLLAQKSSTWTFNATASKTEPDLETTFCALVALQQQDPGLISKDCLGHVANLLIAYETSPGGPYKPPGAEIDLIANCHIAHFLQTVAAPLPKLTSLLEEAIIRQNFTNCEYRTIYGAMYCVAQTYTGPQRQALIEHLLDRMAAVLPQTIADTAFASIIVGQDKKSPAAKKAVQWLIEQQKPDGSWAGEKKWFEDNGVLTTSYAILALQEIQQDLKQHPAK